jgi:hypothetical protein
MGGDPLWTKIMPLDNLGFPGSSVSLDSMIVDAANNVVPAGRLDGGLHIDNALITSFHPDINAYAVKLEGSTGNHLFSKTFGGLGGTTDYGLVHVGADSGGTLFGETFGYSALFIDHTHVARLGAPAWEKDVGNSQITVQAQGFSVDPAGNSRVLFFASHGGVLFASYDYGGGPVEGLALVGYDAVGQHLFSKSISQQPAQIMVGDGAGDSFLLGTNVIDKRDATGNLVWTKAISTAVTMVSPGQEILPDGLGNLWCVVAFQGAIDFGAGAINSGADKAVAVVKLDAMGNQLWAKVFTGAGFAPKVSHDAVKGGRLAMMWSYTGAISFGGPAMNGGVFIVELDASGTLVWQRDLPGLSLGATDSAVALDAAGAAFVGSTSQALGSGLPPGNNKGLFVTKLSP